MKLISVLIIVLLSSLSFADECSDYSDVPSEVMKSVGNLKGKSSVDTIEILKEEFKISIENFAQVNSIEILLKDFDGENLVYSVKEEDNIWSADGGSSYSVLVNALNGTVDISTKSCWMSGE